jgi:hypothetical protein
MPSYGRNEGLSYERQPLKRGRPLRAMPLKAKASFKPKKKERPSDVAVANVMDITNFLARYLSGKQNVTVIPSGDEDHFAVAQKEINKRPYYAITVPDWRQYYLPVDGFSKWRIYRCGNWHETCHIRYSPEEVFTWGKNGIDRFVLNVLEDRRIEDLGVKQWPGYLPERLHQQAYAYALRPALSTIADPKLPPDDDANKKARMEAFLQRLLIGRTKDALPDPGQAKMVEDVAKEMEERLGSLNKDIESKNYNGATVAHYMGMMVRDVISKLNVSPNPPVNPNRPPSLPPGLGGDEGKSDPDNPAPADYDETFSSKEARKQKKGKQGVEKEVEDFFKETEKNAKKEKREDGKTDPNEVTKEDVGTARDGTAEVTDEYQKIQRQEKFDPMLTGWQPIPTQVPAEMYRDQDFITKMGSALSVWKTGSEDLLGKTGRRLSVSDFIRTRGETPFTSRLKKSVRGKKLLILADFSGSMAPQQDEYKRALISGIEVLSGIGSNIALFGFGTDPAYGDKFFKIKDFEDPKWTPTHSNKLAAVDAGFDYTPTAEAYKRLRPYIKKTRPYATLTVTDGSPDPPASPQDETVGDLVKDLKKNTRMIAWGIARGPGAKETMEGMLKGFGYHESFAVTDIHDIPKKLVKTIVPNP